MQRVQSITHRRADTCTHPRCISTLGAHIVGLSRKFSCILSLPSSKSVSRQGPEEHAFYTQLLVAKNSICQRSVPSSLILRKLGQVPSTCAAGKYVYLITRERGEKEKREPSNVRVIARNSRTISIQSSRQGSASSMSAAADPCLSSSVKSAGIIISHFRISACSLTHSARK